jgi:hypothetical protein
MTTLVILQHDLVTLLPTERLGQSLTDFVGSMFSTFPHFVSGVFSPMPNGVCCAFDVPSRFLGKTVVSAQRRVR